MLGQRLKKLRGKRTQEEVAKHIGISRARYAHYENERSEPDIETLQKLADYFNVSIDFLLGRTNEPFPTGHRGIYANILNDYIQKSGKSIEQIAKECKEKRLPINPYYIEKWRTGEYPPPTEAISKVLAEVVNGDPDELILASYMDGTPEELRKLLDEISDIDDLIGDLISLLVETIKNDEDANVEFDELKKMLVMLGRRLTSSFSADDYSKSIEEIARKIIDNSDLRAKKILLLELSSFARRIQKR